MNGWKTYLAALLGILVVGAQAQGYIGEETARLIAEVLAFLGLAGLRHGIDKGAPKT